MCLLISKKATNFKPFLPVLVCTMAILASCAISGGTGHFSDKIESRNISSKEGEKEMSFFPWIVDPHEIFIRSERPLNSGSIKLYNHHDDPLPIDFIENSEHGTTIKMSNNLNFLNNHYIIIDNIKKYALYSKEILNRYFRSNDTLGPTYDGENLSINIWSPVATKIEAIFFDQSGNDNIISKKIFERKDNGIWNLTKTNKDFRVETLHGMYYTLKITAFGKTGIGLDPYAKSLAAFNPNKDEYAKAAIINPAKVKLAGFSEDSYSNESALKSPMEYIGYELHIRDFTISPTIDIPLEKRGTYEGINHIVPYLKDLGITHVQLMPIQTFYTVNELDHSFQDGHISSDQINYNWGYDAQHYFAPEGWYSKNPTDAGSRIIELKKMVKTLHDSGIGVVMDVVYNHVYDMVKFEAIAPGCYLRRNDFGEISFKSGAGASLETRTEMVRKLFIDSVLYFKNEFHIDGLRFDLMGFLDHESLNRLHKKVGDNFIMYGEAWEFTDLPPHEALTKSNLPGHIPIGAFNDSSRDAYTGHMEGEGFIQGAFHHGPKSKTGIIGGIKNYNTDYNGDGKKDVDISNDLYHRYANGPINTINFLTIHDGFTLWDKINLSVSGDEKERIRYTKMAEAMLFTSQGRIVIHGGMEKGRSKPLASNDPNPNRAHTSEKIDSENGVSFFHENSYKSPDTTNSVIWTKSEKETSLTKYTKGLIKLRRTYEAFRYETSEEINGHLRFIAEQVPTVDNEIMMGTKTPHDSWEDIDSLTIEFVEGPLNEKVYLAGEVHGMDKDKNPVNNPYYVLFDQYGKGSINFTKEQLKTFDLKSWSDPEGLQFKIVMAPGKWDSPKGAYTPTGNNTIIPELLTEKNRAKIDLSIVNDTAGVNEAPHSSYIAYTLDSLTADGRYSKFICIHNGDRSALELNISEAKCGSVEILVDENFAGTTPITNSPVKINNGSIYVPRKSSTVIGCLK